MFVDAMPFSLNHTMHHRTNHATPSSFPFATTNTRRFLFVPPPTITFSTTAAHVPHESLESLE
jgi:hypothetical protein